MPKSTIRKCPACNGHGVLVEKTDRKGDFTSMPCEACKGTGKHMTIEDRPKSIDELMHSPDMRETSAALLVNNVLMHIGQFVYQQSKAIVNKTPPAETAIGMVRDMKQLIREYERSYGEAN